MKRYMIFLLIPMFFMFFGCSQIQDRFVVTKIPVILKASNVVFKKGDKMTTQILNGRFDLTAEIVDIGRRGMHIKITTKDVQDGSEHVILDDSGYDWKNGNMFVLSSVPSFSKLTIQMIKNRRSADHELHFTFTYPASKQDQMKEILKTATFKM